MTASPPFVSSVPGPSAVAGADELLKGTGQFEDGVHVPDQQHALAARAGVVRDEVSGALHRVHGNPAYREAEGLQLGLHAPRDLAHAGQILRSAVDVH
jgi:hypothetical protein